MFKLRCFFGKKGGEKTMSEVLKSIFHRLVASLDIDTKRYLLVVNGFYNVIARRSRSDRITFNFCLLPLILSLVSCLLT